MADSLIPDKDLDIMQRLETFAHGVAANPAVYALSQSDSDTIVQTVNQYVAALTIVSDPAKRTAVTIAHKDDARNAAIGLVRTFANIIRANKGISDGDKLAIGIKPRKTSMTPRPCPCTSPRLHFIGATPGSFTIRFGDTLSPNSKAKPFSAVRLELFMSLADPEEIPSAPELPVDGFFGEDKTWAWYVGSFSSNPILVKMPNPPVPRIAVYWGRWANHIGDTGPWSLTMVAGWVGKMKAAKHEMEAKPAPQASDAPLKITA